ncbi:MAG: transporter [Planctomycetes bacterium]|nr:transporter [Planctomycetota bacterium]NUQ34904.1 transporter [Planctomycetaceae bacterium]
MFRRASVSVIAAGMLLAFNPALRADHGPGTSGGGIGTQSGEILKPGEFSLSARLDFTSYEELSETNIRNRTFNVSGDDAHFDALRWSMLKTFELTYGLFDNFQIGASFGIYHGEDLREGHIHGDESYGFHNFGDISGMTDPWLNAKLCLSSGPEGHLSVFGGIKFPWGDDEETGDGEDEPLEPSLQPGSGAYDYSFGAAYSRWLSPQTSFDASIQHTFRTENKNFKIGDATVYSMALAYRLTESAATFPQVSVFGEATLRDQFENEEDGESVSNSGGPVFFLSPGLRFGIAEWMAASFAGQFPVVQNLNDEQQETDFKLTFSLNFSF